MRICGIAACVMAVALGASPLAYSAPGVGSAATGADAGWTNGFDLAGGVDGSALLVAGGWTNGHDLPSGGERSGLLVAGGWTNGYDLASDGDGALTVAAKLK